MLCILKGDPRTQLPRPVQPDGNKGGAPKCTVGLPSIRAKAGAKAGEVGYGTRKKRRKVENLHGAGLKQRRLRHPRGPTGGQRKLRENETRTILVG